MNFEENLLFNFKQCIISGDLSALAKKCHHRHFTNANDLTNFGLSGQIFKLRIADKICPG